METNATIVRAGQRAAHNGVRRRGVLAGATLLPAVLAACTSGPPASEGDATASAPAGAISFWHWGSQDYFVRYRTLSDEFQKRNPKVSVEVTLVEPGMEQKLLAAITGGAPPNAFVHDFQRAQGWGWWSRWTTGPRSPACSR